MLLNIQVWEICRVLGKLEPSAQMVFKNRRPDHTSKGWAKRGGVKIDTRATT